MTWDEYKPLNAGRVWVFVLACRPRLRRGVVWCSAVQCWKGRQQQPLHRQVWATALLETRGAEVTDRR